MQPKIDSDIWNDPEFERLDGDAKLAVIYIITKADILGRVEISKRRFEFDTGKPFEALTNGLQGLPKSLLTPYEDLKAAGDTLFIWVRNFIGKQFGRGESLVRNNLGRSVIRALSASDASIQDLVLAEYPELSEALTKPLPSPLKPLVSPSKDKEKEQEKEKEKEKEKEQGGVQGRDLEPEPIIEPQPRQTVSPANPADEDRRSRLGALFGRSGTLQWSSIENAAYMARRKEITEEHLALIERYYRTPHDPKNRADKFRRNSLATLLDNWAGEVGNANAWDKAQTAKTASKLVF